MLRTICLHGPESSGKSTLAPQLAAHFDTVCVAEFGRTYRERFGTELAMADLIRIAHGQDAKARAAAARGRFPVILDTDPLTSAVCAEMRFGRRDRWFDAWSNAADLYLLLDADLPWTADGARRAGSDAERRRFLDLSRAELDRRGIRHAAVSGRGTMRFLGALAVIRGVAGAPLRRAG